MIFSSPHAARRARVIPLYGAIIVMIATCVVVGYMYLGAGTPATPTTVPVTGSTSATPVAPIKSAPAAPIMSEKSSQSGVLYGSTTEDSKENQHKPAEEEGKQSGVLYGSTHN